MADDDDDDIFRETRGEVTVEWQIRDFFGPSHQRGDWELSPTFWLSDALFRIEIYPNGDNKEESAGWISLYVEKMGFATEEQQVSISSGVMKLDGSYAKYVDLEYTFETGGGYWEFPKFIQRSELSDSENVVNQSGGVTFFCTIRVLDGRIKESAAQTVTPEGVVNLIKNFKDLFLNGRFSDVKLKVKDREFDAHKSVLAARSYVFAAMFEHKSQESNSGVVDIADCESDTFEDFLLFLYTGQLNEVSPSNVLGLYKTADKYSITDLKEECSQRMTSELSVDLICDVVHLAEMYKDSELLENATEFFIDNAEEIFTSAKWQTFYADANSLATELLVKLAQRNK